jgi:hypothetical protein
MLDSCRREPMNLQRCDSSDMPRRAGQRQPPEDVSFVT